MIEWINVKEKLPDEGSYVYVKMKVYLILTKSKNIKALYLKKYFNVKGENVTKWVTHWRPCLEHPKYE
jgi:Protein of unknown function (DUF551)